MKIRFTPSGNDNDRQLHIVLDVDDHEHDTLSRANILSRGLVRDGDRIVAVGDLLGTGATLRLRGGETHDSVECLISMELKCLAAPLHIQL